MDTVFSSPTLVASVVSLAIVVVTWLIRDNFGESRADQLIKLTQVSSETARLSTEAALQAVTEVEHSLKKYSDASDEELKNAAVKLAADILGAWGVFVDEDTLKALFATVEMVYRRYVKQPAEFHSLPVEA